LLRARHGTELALSRLLEGMRILLLEDEALIALDVEEQCREQGASTVLIARNLATARSIGIAGQVDAAILEAMLGGEPTTPFARTLKTMGIPFIFATGHVESEDLLASFAGAPVVSKPYGGSTLIETLLAAIAGRRDQTTATEPST
jgi:DNA-binding response OmpR family regulator